MIECPTAHDSYTVSEAGSISGMSAGDMIFVSDETGGAPMAFYDGLIEKSTRQSSY